MPYIFKITTDNTLELIECDGNKGYTWWMEQMHGYVEHVRPKRLYSDLGADDSVSMLVDEDGHAKGLELNLIGSILYGTDTHGSPILGDILIVGEKRINGEIYFSGLSDKMYDLLYPKFKVLCKRGEEIKV